MTKSQYESADWLTFLSDKEKSRIDSLNRKNKNSLTDSQMRNLARKHNSARMAYDYSTMAKIEYRLIRIGFQTELYKLRSGNYTECSTRKVVATC